MPRSRLEKNDALRIAEKIGARVEKDGKHQRAILWHEGKLILVFRIRHGSRTGQGHLVGENHDLKLNATKALALARCTLTREDYFVILRERGVIEEA